jgi:deoxycytidylate deaminase
MPSIKDVKFLEKASRLAEKSPLAFKLGCVAVLGGKIIETGYNSYKNSCSNQFIKNACSCHAEMDVLHKCGKKHGFNKFNKITLYIARVNNHNNLRTSRPCSECLKYIKKVNVKKIVYVDEDLDIIVQRPCMCTGSHRSFGYSFIEKKMGVNTTTSLSRNTTTSLHRIYVK